MRKGNFLYQGFGIDPCQPNLEVKEVVEKMRMLQHRIRIIEDTGFFTAAELFQKLDYFLITSVLIVPPDKSMLIYMKDGNIGLMDSHEHGPHGAIIATSSTSNIFNFVNYLCGMVKRHLNGETSLECITCRVKLCCNSTRG